MKKLLSTSLIVTLLFFVTISCKKYEDGPMFSLASKKGRVAGVWKIESATEDGVDATAYYQSLLTSIEFKKNGEAISSYTDGTTSEVLKWEFDGKKENITIDHPEEEFTENWEILRLKQKEFWIRTEDDGTIVEIHFKQ